MSVHFFKIEAVSPELISGIRAPCESCHVLITSRLVSRELWAPT